MTEIAASAPGYYRVEEALLSLATRGAQGVDATTAHFDTDQNLHMSRERVRLWR